MASYLIRRILYAFPILLGVCFVVFFLFNIAGGDPALMLVGKSGTQEQITQIREQLGLNKSKPMQYVDTVKSAFTLDFGRSWSSKQEIRKMIIERGKVSLSFTVPAFVISIFLSVIISLIVAYYRGKGIDIFIRFFCIAGISISSLAYILFFQHYFAFELRLFEISGYEYGFPNFLPYVSLPIMIWVTLSLGRDVRFFRTVILDEIYQDYVRTARAKGLREVHILLKHVLKNAMIPIITYTVLQIPFLILGGLLLESFFSIPGLGSMVLNALNSSDYPVIKAMTIVLSMLYIAFSLLTDVLYTIVDPRVNLK